MTGTVPCMLQPAPQSSSQPHLPGSCRPSTLIWRAAVTSAARLSSFRCFMWLSCRACRARSPPTHSKTARRVSSSAPHHASSQAQQRHSLKQGPSHRYTTLASAGTCPPHKPAEQHKQEQKQPQLQLDPLTASLGRRWITPTSRWAEMAGPSHRVRSARCASPLRAARPASDVCSQLSARWRRLQCPLNALCADSRDTQIME